MCLSPESMLADIHLALTHPVNLTNEQCLQDFATSFGMDYRPRLCVETGNIDLTVTAINDSAVKCQLSLYQLECAEHLPVSATDAAPATATLAEVRPSPYSQHTCVDGL